MTDEQLLDMAQRRLDDFGTVTWLAQAPRPGRRFSPREMRHLVDRALELVSDLYVNLPFKREIYATDPVQALRNLRNGLLDDERGGLTTDEEEFHERLATIFVGLRDRHTVYILPEPYRRRIAFLPFVVESFVPEIGADPVYVLTKVFGDDLGDGFRAPEREGPAVRVTHWNGVPIKRAVATNADRNSGANQAARLARGLDRLTFRWLGTAVSPDEDWVTVSYNTPGSHEILHKRFHWLVVEAPEAMFVEDTPTEGLPDTAMGRDLEGEWIRRVKAGLHRKKDKWAEFAGRDGVAFRLHRQGDETYGYLRVYTFDLEPEEIDAFVSEVAGLVASEPTDGLIIDVRGNPGGQIPAAERLIALFSPVPVEQQRLNFRNTPEATTLAERLFRDRVGPFGMNVQEARATAAPFLASLSLGDDPDDAQAYQEPVVVLFDALTYSAGEVFVAGMLDQRLAIVTGTARQTGGGGANVWPDALVREIMGEKPPAKLPFGASFNVSIRRITRIGARAGVAIEDLGVFVQEGEVIRITERDLTGDNAHLIGKAAARMAGEPRRSLNATHDGARTFTLKSDGIARVDVLFDGELFRAFWDPSGATVDVPRDDPMPTRVDFLGYVGGSRPVTSFRWQQA